MELRPVSQKPPKPKRDPAHMAKVAALPCVICHLYGLSQLSPTQVHHVIHGRFGNARSGDDLTIPLCEGHHQGNWDSSKIALHREPERWQELYGKDYDLLGWVRDRLCMTID